MPTGTPYDSFVVPYRIRVDDFSSSPDSDPTFLHLLTHTHSDHVNGLSAKSFGFKVYCSEDAKEMLLRHEVYYERELQARELRSEKIRTFSHLKVDPLVYPDGTKYYQGSRDLLHPLPLDSPTRIELAANEEILLTLIGANHCPGAVMFLIEGQRGAILHTGDFRAEPWFINSLSHNPSLQQYLFSEQDYLSDADSKKSSAPLLSKSLEAIYLDTACVLSPLDIPAKEHATSGLVDLMKYFPDSVYFFINSWTWGYEDILKAIARAFQSQIHVDRYKHGIYQRISDTFLRSITTLDPLSTRFHACERFHRCPFVSVENDYGYANAISAMGKRVIYVNPVTMSTAKWLLYMDNVKSSLKSGAEINNLLVPLSRHSTLPELQAFVKLFRPKRIVPNTLDPRLKNLDWVCIDHIFLSCLHPFSQQPSSVLSSMRLRLGVTSADQLSSDAQNDCDTALKNLVGNGAASAAERWADHGKLLKKLSIIRDYLGPSENAMIDELLGLRVPAQQIETVGVTTPPLDSPTRLLLDKRKQSEVLLSHYLNKDRRDSDDETEMSSDDDRGRTAHKLFASMAGIGSDDKENTWWFSSQPSLDEPAAGTSNVLEGITHVKSRAEPGGDGAWRINRFTPVSSPVRPQRVNAKVHRNNATPSTVSVVSPAREIKPQGNGNTLSSPICLLSSSPGIANNKSDQDVGARRNTSSARRLSFSKPRGLAASQSPSPSSEVKPKSRLAITGKIKNTSLNSTTNQITHSPVQVPSKRKFISQDECAAASKNFFNETQCSIEQGVMPNGGPASPLRHDAIVHYVPSKKEHIQIERIDIAQQMFIAYPHLGASSYPKKRERQLARLDRKKKGYAKIDAATNLKEADVSFTSSSPGPRPFAPARTIESFEVDDGDAGIDWNRSRQLADAMVEDLRKGRKPSVPLLMCTESQ